MNSEILIGMALGLESPWKITGLDFKSSNSSKELHIHISFKKGAKFKDELGNPCPVHDTIKKQWQHLNFFEHSCHLHCNVPRIKKTNGKVNMVEVPWARKNSGFTLLFEALAMAMIENEMPINKVAKFMRVLPQRIWTIFNHWIKKAYLADYVKCISKLGIDETSSKKGHNYVTLGVDLDSSRVIFATEGKGKKTITDLQQYLETKGVEAKEITDISIDLSPSFISGAKASFPDAKITFDRFHVVKLLNKAMDTVRKLERKEYESLKGHKYTFLRNPENLTDKKTDELKILVQIYPLLGEAYRLKESFNLLWEMPDIQKATKYFDAWCDYVTNQSEIPAFVKFARTAQAHKAGIINFAKTRISNGILEGLNCKIQLAKRRARGYRNIENFKNMIYFLCGKLKFDYPLYFT